MQYKVPKFLEREARIIGPVTFKQLAYLGAAALVLLILYYALPLNIFLLCFFLIGGVVFALVFLKIEGIPLGQLLPQYFGFFGSSKTFIWRKKEVLTPIKLVEKKKEEKKEEMAPLRVAPESKLGKLSSKLDIGLR